MTVLVISDTHLGKTFNPKKYDYLYDLFSKYSLIVLNGDFWDYYSFSFEDFLNSKWSDLFEIMKDKTIYIYGNHDKKEYADERVSLFSKEQHEEYCLPIGNKTFIFTHGHKIDGFKQNEKAWFVTLDRLLKLNDIGLVLDYLSIYFAKNRDANFKGFAKNLSDNEVLVVGHKHIPLVNLKEKYVLGGSVLFGRAYYLVISDSGEVIVIEERY